MSWKDRESAEYIITTGDGAKYHPFWMRQSVSRKFDFNIAKFNFKDIPGTLVSRGTIQGGNYDLEIKFQGDDHLNTADAFLKSAKNSRAWIIAHPTYGTLYVQPCCISFDNSKANVTTINCEVTETITSTGLEITSSPADVVTANSLVANDTFGKTTAVILSTPNVPVLIQLKNFIDGTYRAILAKIAPIQQELTDLNNAYNAINNLINTTIYDVTDLVKKLHDFAMVAVKFANSVEARLDMYITALTDLGNDIAFLLTPDSKRIFETNAGVIISAMCTTTFTNIADDYKYRPDALAIIQILVDAYNNYITNLNGLQTLNGGELNSYMPDPDSIIALQGLVSYAIKSLLLLSVNSKQQLIYTLPYDTNLIAAAYLLYGLLPDDSTIQQLIDNNNIGMGGTIEILILKAGRKIIYYT